MSQHITFNCPACGGKLRTPVTAIGKTGTCGKCGHKSMVPLLTDDSTNDLEAPALVDVNRLDVTGLSAASANTVDAPQEIPLGQPSVDETQPSDIVNPPAQFEEETYGVRWDGVGSNSAIPEPSVPLAVDHPLEKEIESEQKVYQVPTVANLLAQRGLPAAEESEAVLISLIARSAFAVICGLMFVLSVIPQTGWPIIVRLAFIPLFGLLTIQNLRQAWLRKTQMSQADWKAIAEIRKSAVPNWVQMFVGKNEEFILILPASSLYAESTPCVDAVPLPNLLAGDAIPGDLLLTSKRLQFISVEGERRDRLGSWQLTQLNSAYIRSGNDELVVHTTDDRLAFRASSGPRLNELIAFIRQRLGVTSSHFKISNSARKILDLYDATLGLMTVSATFSFKGFIGGAITSALMGENVIVGALVGNQLDRASHKSDNSEGKIKTEAARLLAERGYPMQSPVQMQVLISALRHSDAPSLIELVRDASNPSLRIGAFSTLRDMGPAAAEALPLLRGLLEDSDTVTRERAMESFSAIMQASD